MNDMQWECVGRRNRYRITKYFAYFILGIVIDVLRYEWSMMLTFDVNIYVS